LLGQPGYLDQELKLATTDAQRVADTQMSRWFGFLAVDFDLAPPNSVLGEGTGLEKASCPQPLVQTGFVVFVSASV